ncbi:MAG: TrkH family potassium uptake protein [Alphaproteobacteria bacterium]
MTAVCIAYRMGWLLVMLAAFMILPVLQSVVEVTAVAALPFLRGAFVTLFVGVGLIAAFRHETPPRSGWAAVVFVTAAWIILPVFAALPILDAVSGLSPLDAYFAAMAALTTTGAGGLAEEQLKTGGVLVWLAVLQWLGGAGALSVATGVFAPILWAGVPLTAVPLPRTPTSLLDRLGTMTRLILPVYTMLTAGVFLVLLICGLPFPNAFCTALSAVATGGLSPTATGFAGFGSPFVPGVVSLAGILGASSILIHWYWMHRRIGPVLADAELRFFIAVLAVASLIAMGLALAAPPVEGQTPSPWQAAFLAVSLVTTSGWTFDGTAFTHGLPVPLILALPAMGAMALSTAGGIKLIRVVLLFKQANRELERLAHPHGVARVKLAGMRIDEGVSNRIGALFMALILTAGALTLAVSAHGVPFMEAISASLSVLSNTGPAFQLATGGQTGYADLPAGAKVLLCVGMVLGRVEVLALLSLLNPAYWRR